MKNKLTCLYEKYSIIYVDPPWLYAEKCVYTKKSFFQASDHYDTVVNSDMCQWDVASLATTNSICYMWATSPKLPEAIELMAAWGFTYKTIAFVWVKTYSEKCPKHVLGLGSYTRSNVELLLLGTKGKPLPRTEARNTMQQVVEAPRERHSAKPKLFAQKIVDLHGDLPRIELFCRGAAEAGWDATGNECATNCMLLQDFITEKKGKKVWTKNN